MPDEPTEEAIAATVRAWEECKRLRDEAVNEAKWLKTSLANLEGELLKRAVFDNSDKRRMRYEIKRLVLCIKQIRNETLTDDLSLHIRVRQRAEDALDKFPDYDE